MIRVTLDKQVNVVICNLQRQNLVTEVVSSLTKQLSHIVFHYIENRVAVLSGIGDPARYAKLRFA